MKFFLIIEFFLFIILFVFTSYNFYFFFILNFYKKSCKLDEKYILKKTLKFFKKKKLQRIRSDEETKFKFYKYSPIEKFVKHKKV